MPLYEHVFLARQDISAQQVEALTKEFSDIIVAGGGKIAKTEYWGLRSLTYKIKKNRKAHYALINIDAPPAAVAEMERRMGLSPDILRFLTVRVEAHETEPSAPLRKADRDERGERGERGGLRGERSDRGGRAGPRGDRPPREAGARADRAPREGSEGAVRAERGDRPPRDAEGSRGPRGPRADGTRPPRPSPSSTEG